MSQIPRPEWHVPSKSLIAEEYVSYVPSFLVQKPCAFQAIVEEHVSCVPSFLLQKKRPKLSQPCLAAAQLKNHTSTDLQVWLLSSEHKHWQTTPTETPTEKPPAN